MYAYDISIWKCYSPVYYLVQKYICKQDYSSLFTHTYIHTRRFKSNLPSPIYCLVHLLPLKSIYRHPTIGWRSHYVHSENFLTPPIIVWRSYFSLKTIYHCLVQAYISKQDCSSPPSIYRLVQVLL